MNKVLHQEWILSAQMELTIEVYVHLHVQMLQRKYMVMTPTDAVSRHYLIISFFVIFLIFSFFVSVISYLDYQER